MGNFSNETVFHTYMLFYVGLDPFLETVYAFYFLLAFYFRILILYSTE